MPKNKEQPKRKSVAGLASHPVKMFFELLKYSQNLIMINGCWFNSLNGLDFGQSNLYTAYVLNKIIFGVF